MNCVECLVPDAEYGLTQEPSVYGGWLHILIEGMSTPNYLGPYCDPCGFAKAVAFAESRAAAAAVKNYVDQAVAFKAGTLVCGWCVQRLATRICPPMCEACQGLDVHQPEEQRAAS